MEQVLGRLDVIDDDKSKSLVVILTERNQQLATENRRLRAKIARLENVIVSVLDKATMEDVRRLVQSARDNGVAEGLSRSACRPGYGEMGG